MYHRDIARVAAYKGIPEISEIKDEKIGFVESVSGLSRSKDGRSKNTGKINM